MIPRPMRSLQRHSHSPSGEVGLLPWEGAMTCYRNATWAQCRSEAPRLYSAHMRRTRIHPHVGLDLCVERLSALKDRAIRKASQ